MNDPNGLGRRLQQFFRAVESALDQPIPPWDPGRPTRRAADQWPLAEVAVALILVTIGGGIAVGLANSHRGGVGIGPTPSPPPVTSVSPATSPCTVAAAPISLAPAQRFGRIDTVAGTGGAGSNGDGGPAAAAQLDGPYAVAVSAGTGALYITDRNVNLRQVSPDGIITSVPNVGGPGTGLVLTSRVLSPPGQQSQAYDTIFIAVFTDNRVYRSDPAPPGGRQLPMTIAGGNIRQPGFSNGGTAEGGMSLLDGPTGLAMDGNGSLYIADSNNNRVRKLLADGTLCTVAGNGRAGFAGDGGAADHAQLSVPTGLAFDSRGNLYISDTGNNRIRRVTPGGIITTVAGTGTAGFSGDSGRAAAAQLNQPIGLAIDAAGNLYIADSKSNRIRMVSPQGIITTVAGRGTQGFGGDGGSAVAAELAAPTGLALDAAGSLYIADTGNNRVRKLSPAS